jgi:hypothetical protein
MRLLRLLLLAGLALTGCATRGLMPEACQLKLDSSFSLVRGEVGTVLLEELNAANAAAAEARFDLKGSKQFVAASVDRAIVCEISSCSPAWWEYVRVDGKWLSQSHSPAVCVVR